MKFPFVIAVASLFAMATAQVAQDGFMRERGGPNDATKNASEGKPPPAFTADSWLNAGATPPTWKSLRGNVVVLDFWAYW